MLCIIEIDFVFKFILDFWNEKKNFFYQYQTFILHNLWTKLINIITVSDWDQWKLDVYICVINNHHVFVHLWSENWT